MKNAHFALIALLLAACGDNSSGAGSQGGSDAGDTALLDGAGGDLGSLDSASDGAVIEPDSQPDTPESDATTGDDTTPDLPPEAPPASINEDRPSPVYVPLEWATRDDWPLVILLHGFGVNGSIQNLYLGISDRVDELGFVLLTPDGTRNATGQRFWNASDYCCDLYDDNIDDVGYINALIDESIERLLVDPDRVYLLGHSNGGFMSYRMACDRADLVTGVGVLAGAMLSDLSECEPSRPVSVLHMHGTMDGTIAYDGSAIGAGHPSAEDSLEWWREYNGCDAEPAQEADADYDTVVDGDETDRLTWSGCDALTSATLWKMEGSSHSPIFNDDYRDEVLEHLLGMAPQD